MTNNICIIIIIINLFFCPISPSYENVLSLSIVNMLGQEEAVLINGWRDIGRHEVRWQGMDSQGIPVASGVYFAVLRDSRQVRITKMMLLK